MLLIVWLCWHRLATWMRAWRLRVCPKACNWCCLCCWATSLCFPARTRRLLPRLTNLAWLWLGPRGWAGERSFRHFVMMWSLDCYWHHMEALGAHFSASICHSLWSDNGGSGRGTKLGLDKMGVENGGCVGLEGKTKKRNRVLWQLCPRTPEGCQMEQGQEVSCLSLQIHPPMEANIIMDKQNFWVRILTQPHLGWRGKCTFTCISIWHLHISFHKIIFIHANMGAFP